MKEVHVNFILNTIFTLGIIAGIVTFIMFARANNPPVGTKINNLQQQIDGLDKRINNLELLLGN